MSDFDLDLITPRKGLPLDQEERRIAIFRHHIQWLLESIPVSPQRSWSVLEAGQGKHGWSDLYRLFFDNVLGSDIEDYSAYHPGVKSLVCDFCDHIPLPDQRVNLLVSHSVLEHVFDVPAALYNFDRVLKVGGFAFITLKPLYYSAEGSHIRHPVRLSNWEHLSPRSEHYLVENPLPGATTKGHSLNRMTFSDFLGWIGALPWSIVRSRLLLDRRPIPPSVDRSRYREIDIRTEGFFLLCKKEWHLDRHRAADPMPAS